MKEKTIYYVTGRRFGKGTEFIYFNASLACKVLRVVELGPKWTAQTQAKQTELRTALGAIPGVTVEMGGKFEPNGTSGRPLNEYCSQ